MIIKHLKKLIILSCLIFIGGKTEAKGYNFVSVGYDNNQVWFHTNTGNPNGLEGIGVNGNNSSLSGYAIQYTHGFSLGNAPMSIEIGLRWSQVFKNVTIDESYLERKLTYNSQLISLSLPLSYAYDFKLFKSLTLTPYAGLDFKLNFKGSTKHKVINSDGSSYEVECGIFENASSYPGNEIQKFYYAQIGWHIGVRGEFKRLFLGLEYGTDFTPLWKTDSDYFHDDENNKYNSGIAHIYSGTFLLSLGFKF